MEMLELYRQRELVGRYSLGRRGLEIGSSAACDVVVLDAEVMERHWLVLRRDGAVQMFDLSAERRERALGKPLALNVEFPLGRHHALKRVGPDPDAAAASRVERATHDLRQGNGRGGDGGRLSIAIGSGGEVRRITVGKRCLQVGRAPDCDLVLTDPAVSERHARLEPADGAVWVRDLGSRNGTFVDGVPIQVACVRHGSTVRVGRTDLRATAPDRCELPARTGVHGAPQLIAQSSEMLQVLSEVQRMAALPWPVLVVGESGTGKEGVATSLHELGPRGERPFVAVNAGGLPRELIESELFGHERGAFTGASGSHRGVFEQAHGGTLFLDEIGELPLELQSRLLRALETGEVRRLGGERAFEVDVRLVCATHRDLRAMVAGGSFRQDLYYRVARLVLHVPALRARPADVGALARHFLEQISGEIGPRELTEEAELRLLAHDWPGNARELRNVLCAAAANSGAYIEPFDIERALIRLGDDVRSRVPPSDACRLALAHCGGNKAAAARALGIPRSTLRDRLTR